MITLWDLLKPVAQMLGIGQAPPALKPPRSGKVAPGRKIQAVRPRKPRKKPVVPTPAVEAESLQLFATESKCAKRPVAATKAPALPAKERYEQVAREMLVKYNIRVRRWRKSMSGLATELKYHDGSTKRLLESPRPKSPLSMAIFLHEVGHHAIGLGVHKPRCLEEYLAWKFSIDTMRELGLPVTDKVLNRMERSMQYAVGKAVRRGIKSLPAEVMVYYKASA
jgi:hypothetical protein